ncbi:D-aminoacylase [Pollutibacter soli]|uniref:N-acyl-D-amino-acid deacylase family protein n=1 Tax=Pollutibacter soli TaxID=3034157 RepID=UPI003013B89E
MRIYFVCASLLSIILFSCKTSQPASTGPADYIIENGKILDGTGNSWFYGDVAVKSGKIIAVGHLANMQATKRINAQKRIVSPGFIDVHAHIENSVFEKPTADNYIHDGVTTVVTGNCGGSADNIKEFLHRIDSVKTSINVASLVGHNTIRRAAMGLDNRLATSAEQQKMEALAEQAMQEGAVGMSTGLIYVPGMFSNTSEVVGIAKVIAKNNGIYASHIRNEENGVRDAIQEAIQIGIDANIPVQISHFKVSGRTNWGRSKETVPMIDSARAKGYDVSIDQYPYTASSTNLGVRIPDWALGGGTDSLKIRLENPELHKRIIEEMIVSQNKYQYPDYSYAFVAYHSADTSLNGKNISRINILKGRKPNMTDEAETILDLMKAGGAQMVYHSMNEEDVKFIIRSPFAMIGADAGVSTGKGMPHPRTYGTNARVLGRYVRELKIISLEEAVRRMTSLAAQKFQLKDRGLLKEGFAADILIFDENTINDKATFENPHQFSTGFALVMVNGQVALENDVQSSTRSGKALYGPATLHVKR